MTGPDTTPRKKRRRRHTVKKPSIYLLPEPIHLSIGKTLAASRIRYDEGTPEAGPSRIGSNPVDTNHDEPGPSKGVKTTQQVRSNGTDAEGDPVEPGPTARPRGWTKKRLNEVAEAARMAEEIGGTDDDLPSDVSATGGSRCGPSSTLGSTKSDSSPRCRAVHVTRPSSAAHQTDAIRTMGQQETPDRATSCPRAGRQKS